MLGTAKPVLASIAGRRDAAGILLQKHVQLVEYVVGHYAAAVGLLKT